MMAEFRVDTDALKAAKGQLGTVQVNLSKTCLELGAMELGSLLQIKASTTLVFQINKARLAAERNAAGIGQMSRALGTVADTYESTERNLSEPKTEDAKKPSAIDWASIIRKIANNANLPIAILTALYFGNRGVEGGGAEDILTALKSAVNGIGQVAGASGRTGADWWQKVLGLSAYNDGTLSFKDCLGDELNKYNFAGGNTVKVAAKWAGAILTAITNAISNYSEYESGEISGQRAVEETIMETIVDIGKGILITAGVAFAIGSAPAVVVGLVAGLITVVVEWAFKEATGVKLTEWASDGILDLVHGIGDGISQVIENGCNNVSAEWASCI